MTKMDTLADLKIGESAIIVAFSDEEMALKLMEMGCIPGEQITVERTAPSGDPIAVSVSGYVMSLRIKEAETITVTGRF